MIKAGIIGATGYAGAELVRILWNHKEVEIVWYGSRSYVDKAYASVYNNMFQLVDAKCLDDNIEELANQVDVIFTATPQGFLAGILTEEILSKVKVIGHGHRHPAHQGHRQQRRPGDRRLPRRTAEPDPHPAGFGAEHRRFPAAAPRQRGRTGAGL